MSWTGHAPSEMTPKIWALRYQRTIVWICSAAGRDARSGGTSQRTTALVLAAARRRGGEFGGLRRKVRHRLDSENFRETQPCAVDPALDRADRAVADFCRLF